MYKTRCTLITALVLGLTSAVMAQTHIASHSNGEVSVMQKPEVMSAAEMVMTSGEVTRVDTRADKLTIRHDDIKNLGMPAMTMVFGLQGEAHANDFKPGDKVRFHAEDKMGVLNITHIQREP